MLIGLTGKYCAGKNHVAALLQARGLPVLDVDKLGYQALEAEKEAVFVQFGSDLQRTDGSLDRRLLGRRVFGDPKKLSLLENIIHPPVNRLTNEWIAAQNGLCVINAALLHRSSAINQLDRLIVVTAPFLTRFLRAKQRDRLKWREILKRFAAQRDFDTQYLSINAEIYRVENWGLGPLGLEPPGLSCGVGGNFGSRNLRKLERRIDKILEGIR